MTAKIFVDESIAKHYLIVAATIRAADSAVADKEVRDLVLPGQRSLHMRSERSSRRRVIADIVTAMAARDLLTATVYDAGTHHGSNRASRAVCLRQLVADAASIPGGALLVLDLADGLRSFDRQQLLEATRAAGASGRLTYEHVHRHEQMLLAIPDAIAWCWARGGEWRRRIAPAVADVRRL